MENVFCSLELELETYINFVWIVNEMTFYKISHYAERAEQTIFFHLDRIIAWLNEVATVAHNNTSRCFRRFGKKQSQNYCLKAKPWMET